MNKKNGVPSGWTNDPLLLNGAPDTQLLEKMQCQANLTEIIPILWSREESVWLMEDGEKYYFWNPIAGDLLLITKPNDIDGIMTLLKQKEWPKCQEVRCD